MTTKKIIARIVIASLCALLLAAFIYEPRRMSVGEALLGGFGTVAGIYVFCKVMFWAVENAD